MIVFPPADALAQHAVAQVQARYPGRAVYRVAASDQTTLEGCHAFVVWTYDRSSAHWHEWAEYHPCTGRWLLLDINTEMAKVSVAAARRYLCGETETLDHDLESLRPSRTASSFGYLMSLVLEHESQRERRKMSHHVWIAS